MATPRPGSTPGGGRHGRRVGASAVTAGLLLLGGATACSSAAPASSASSPAAGGTTSADPVSVSDVTLNIGDQAGAGSEALLTAAGLINKLPFKAHWSDFTSGPPMLQAMGAGSIDIGEVGDAPPVFAAAGGSQIAVVSALQANTDGSAILVPKNSPIHTVAQLRGKSVAVAQGSSANYHLLAELTKSGLTIKDVTPDYLQPAEGQAAFASGHVAAWDVWSPFIEQAEYQDHARILVNGAGIGQTYSFVVAARAALNNPAKATAIHDYLQLLDQAYTWAQSHQSAWASTWAKATGLPLSVMAQAVKDSLATPQAITPTVITSEQSVANAFTAAGLIPGHVDFSNFAVTSFNSVLGASS
ncbi:MAG TPA: ABC transporter substrate-binding protein [Streptosporangiaceae bacterium]|nr:ABC transporter substrate-binding protein [Streptosporangiaceae bacterium]